MNSNSWLTTKTNASVSTAMGFGLGGAAHFLFLLPWDLLFSIIGLGVAGGIAGAFIGYRSNRPRSALLTCIAYGLGFMLGGFISVTMLVGLLKMSGAPELPFTDFYVLFVLGFSIAGAVSAALIRPRLISVKHSAICFLVGSAVGGLVVGVLLDSPLRRLYVAAIGLLITYATSGAVSGRVLDFLDGRREST